MSQKHESTNTIFYGVGGVTVSMVAFQAVDPGSTPGRRRLLKFKISLLLRQQIQFSGMNIITVGTIF